MRIAILLVHLAVGPGLMIAGSLIGSDCAIITGGGANIVCILVLRPAALRWVDRRESSRGSR